MPVVTTRQLLEAGVHFGHQTRRWNPKMKRFIFTERNGIYILDLQQTVHGIEEAYKFVRDLVAGGGTILFVATKKQVQDAVQEQADRSGMPFVNFRWLGGMLTNFRTMHERIKRMRELEEMVSTGSMEALPKKEALKLQRQYEKLARNLGGLRNVDKAPDAIFVLDTKKEEIAVREAKKLGIPIVAVLDTNSDPDDADYGIPGNDDAIRSGALLTRIIADAVIEGRSMRPHEEMPDGSPAGASKPDVLPGAAAEPKAEWELQLEAEEAAEKGDQRVLDSTKPVPDPAAGEPGTSTAPDPAPEPVKDEPGDKSHPAPKSAGV
ncbi:MAG: small subunit ribosomal protein [Actinomycetota bacterium]|jgi:small subunit ribosomal protein S2|nr:small subunit ribosomal protein [Actinomycetota bacterium]